VTRRRTSRRKGPRTGGIEVPRNIIRDVMRRIDGIIVRTEASDDDVVFARVMGRPVPESSVQIPKRPFPEDDFVARHAGREWWEKKGAYEWDLGRYEVPSIKPYSRKWPVTVRLVDSEHDAQAMTDKWGGYVKVDAAVGQASKAETRRCVDAALRSLGASRADLPRDADLDLLCKFQATPGLTIVLRAVFETSLLWNRARARLQSTLVHEVAHAMDEGLRQSWIRYIDELNQDGCLSDVRELLGLEYSSPWVEDEGRGVSEGSAEWSEEMWTRYFNLPTEVVARLSQAVPHLTSIGAEMALDNALREDGFSDRVLMDWALRWSPSIRAMWPYLSDSNQRRVLRSVYDMGESMIEIAARRRPTVLPNRRGR